MDAQELQDTETFSTIWVKNFNKILNKTNSTKSLMIDMKPKDAIKLETVPLNKKCPEETVLSEVRCYSPGSYNYLYKPFIQIFISTW